MIRFWYLIFRAWSEFDLVLAQYRRDLIDREMMHGRDIDVIELQHRRQRISFEVRAILADLDRWNHALHCLDLNTAPFAASDPVPTERTS